MQIYELIFSTVEFDVTYILTVRIAYMKRERPNKALPLHFHKWVHFSETVHISIHYNYLICEPKPVYLLVSTTLTLYMYSHTIKIKMGAPAVEVEFEKEDTLCIVDDESWAQHTHSTPHMLTTKWPSCSNILCTCIQLFVSCYIYECWK